MAGPMDKTDSGKMADPMDKMDSGKMAEPWTRWIPAKWRRRRNDLGAESHSRLSASRLGMSASRGEQGHKVRT